MYCSEASRTAGKQPQPAVDCLLSSAQMAEILRADEGKTFTRAGLVAGTRQGRSHTQLVYLGINVSMYKQYVRENARAYPTGPAVLLRGLTKLLVICNKGIRRGVGSGGCRAGKRRQTKQIYTRA